MDRRSFIKKSSLAGIGLSTMPIKMIKKQNTSSSTPKKKIIVAGAGISGLCCAYELMEMGHEVVVLEAAGRYGGTVLTVHDGLADGLYADYGAENITKPGYKNYWKYIEKFNIPVLPYLHRKNRMTREGDEWLTKADLQQRQKKQLNKLGGLNEKESRYLSSRSFENLFTNLEKFYLGPYLEKFKDEYQPFGIGFDHLDEVPISEIYKKEGASKAALQVLGGGNTSALYKLWQSYIKKKRGYWGEYDLYRIKGGNDILPEEFAKRLGKRVKLGCKILEIEHDDTGVTIAYREFGQEKRISADYLANCLPVSALRNIVITPDLPPEKKFIINQITYEQKSRIVFQARTEFWKQDNISINLTFNHPQLRTIWQVAQEVDTHRAILMAKASAGTNPLRALEVFKEHYPGDKSNINIEQALVKDWSMDQFTPGCERGGFPMGNLSKFWPYLIEAHGRIYFAGGYADNRSWGMEAATNSANRVAREIDQV